MKAFILASLVMGSVLTQTNSASASWKNDPPEVKIGSSCGTDSKCLARLNKAVGFQLGRYKECERLNNIVCDAVAPGKSGKIQCEVSKFVSTVIKDDCRPAPVSADGCGYQTNTIIIDFTKEFPAGFGMTQVPFIESETGYKYSCN